MIEAPLHISLLMAIVGVVIFLGPFLRIIFDRVNLPFLIGFILLGFLLHIVSTFLAHPLATLVARITVCDATGDDLQIPKIYCYE